MLFTLFATVTLGGLNVRRWLTWYLEGCAEQGGQAPSDIEPFLPWNLSVERRLALTLDRADSS